MMEALLRYVQSVQRSSIQRAACMAGFVEHLIVVYSQGVCEGCGERGCSEGVNKNGSESGERVCGEGGEQANAGTIEHLTSHNTSHNNTLLDTAFAILHQQTPSHALHLALQYHYHPFLFSLPLQTVLVPSLPPPHP